MPVSYGSPGFLGLECSRCLASCGGECSALWESQPLCVFHNGCFVSISATLARVGKTMIFALREQYEKSSYIWIASFRREWLWWTVGRTAEFIPVGGAKLVVLRIGFLFEPGTEDLPCLAHVTQPFRRHEAIQMLGVGFILFSERKITSFPDVPAWRDIGNEHPIAGDVKVVGIPISALHSPPQEARSVSTLDRRNRG